ncbi:MAG: hypothetical protein FWE11_10875 [Defluviitaleaceae bacterium]|nr:hypothetical protein [Defluviitaleaceae bacterium]
MSFLRKYVDIKDKKIIIYLVMIAAAGVLLMLWGRGERQSPEPQKPEERPVVTTTEEPQPVQLTRPERTLEEELEAFLSLVAGAGQVRVMVSALGDRETIFAVDSTSSNSHIQEEDAGGGTRDQRQHSTQTQTVIITDRNGIDQPLVLREIAPRVEGIVIIAQGGDDPFVRDALTRAAQAVLGVEIHMIQVLTMAHTDSE